MNNLYIYILTTDQYKYDITVICMILTLTFFTAKIKTDIVQQIYRILVSEKGFNKESIEKLKSCKSFILKKLKELGSKETEVDFLDKEIDFDKYMGDGFKVGTLLE